MEQEKTLLERVEATGIKKQHIAEKLGMDKTTLSKTLRGRLPYSPAKNTAAIERFLGALEPGAKIILENSQKNLAINE